MRYFLIFKFLKLANSRGYGCLLLAITLLTSWAGAGRGGFIFFSILRLILTFSIRSQSFSPTDNLTTALTGTRNKWVDRCNATSHAAGTHDVGALSSRICGWWGSFSIAWSIVNRRSRWWRYARYLSGNSWTDRRWRESWTRSGKRRSSWRGSWISWRSGATRIVGTKVISVCGDAGRCIIAGRRLMIDIAGWTSTVSARRRRSAGRRLWYKHRIGCMDWRCEVHVSRVASYHGLQSVTNENHSKSVNLVEHSFSATAGQRDSVIRKEVIQMRLHKRAVDFKLMLELVARTIHFFLLIRLRHLWTY